ncbi:MAG TPA: methyltransferase [Candidatus Paceibacterota bacterium]|nr:methyltransferase [Verrucomicrobiota bacterium]HSA08985.1 methyltransferase [Candidatus Paceibacterota bacterium]
MKPQTPQSWTSEKILALGRNYQGAAVLAAAADLDLFGALARTPLTAAQLARKRQCDLRALTVLLDALAALRLLVKSGGNYVLPAGLDACLTSDGPQSVLAMAQHQANCLRRWAQLATAVKTGRPVRRTPSVRGESGDEESFIGAMHNISAPNADRVIRAVRPLRFRRLLDIGGASGTWTIAFLRACPSARATLFDLPHVLPMARRRLAAARLDQRVKLVAGDFTRGALPPGADLAWVSAIVHQNSRAQNRALFAKVFAVLTPGGRIAIRDILMEADRTQPVAGALFAVNMLVATRGGGTFTFAELRQDLEAAGFVETTVARADEAMNAIVVARRPVGA